MTEISKEIKSDDSDGTNNSSYPKVVSSREILNY